MADHRSRRQKLEAVIAPNSGATEGEKANARSLLAKMKPEPAAPPPRAQRWSTSFSTSTASANLKYDDVLEWMLRSTPPRPKRPLEDVPTEELLRRWSASRSEHSWSRGTSRDEVRAAMAFSDSMAKLCRTSGTHDYVVIGHSMFHTPIRRCLRCGVYDPPRKEYAHGSGEEGPNGSV